MLSQCANIDSGVTLREEERRPQAALRDGARLQAGVARAVGAFHTAVIPSGKLDSTAFAGESISPQLARITHLACARLLLHLGRMRQRQEMPEAAPLRVVEVLVRQEVEVREVRQRREVANYCAAQARAQ